MRTLAGGYQVDERCFVDPRPNQNRATVPESAVEAFLAANTFYCQAFAARIRPEQCKLNRANNNYICGKCTQEMPESVAALPARARKRRKGDNPASPWRQNPIMIRKELRPEAVAPQVREMLRLMAKKGNAQAATILIEAEQ